jgi:hypothetical protein
MAAVQPLPPQVWEANAGAPNANRIRLIDRKLRAVGIAGKQKPTAML